MIQFSIIVAILTPVIASLWIDPMEPLSSRIIRLNILLATRIVVVSTCSSVFASDAIVEFVAFFLIFKREQSRRIIANMATMIENCIIFFMLVFGND